MRISSEQTSLIRTEVEKHLGPESRVWLFGSRTDDRRRGGDLDLFVETGGRVGLLQILRCKYRLEELFDLRVDLVVKEPGRDKPIFKIAKSRGVLL